MRCGSSILPRPLSFLAPMKNHVGNAWKCVERLNLNDMVSCYNLLWMPANGSLGYRSSPICASLRWPASSNTCFGIFHWWVSWSCFKHFWPGELRWSEFWLNDQATIPITPKMLLESGHLTCELGFQHISALSVAGSYSELGVKVRVVT